jgi:hypothetical protein
MDTRTPYLIDVSGEEWDFVAPYFTSLPEDAGQRKYALREVFNGAGRAARRYLDGTGWASATCADVRAPVARSILWTRAIAPSPTSR